MDLRQDQGEFAWQCAGASFSTSCCQPWATRNAMLPLMQARNSPSRRALLGPGSRTGSRTGKGATTVLALSPGPAAAVLAVAAPVPVPAEDTCAGPAVTGSKAEVALTCSAAECFTTIALVANPIALATRTPAATAAATGRKNDQGLTSSRKSRGFMPCPPLFAERSAFTSGTVSHPDQYRPVDSVVC